MLLLKSFEMKSTLSAALSFQGEIRRKSPIEKSGFAPFEDTEKEKKSINQA